MIHLIQSTEEFGPPARVEELKYVWEKNEGLFDAHTDYTGRPVFSELLALSRPEYVTVIANADIHFDREGVELIRQIPEKTLYCLSRYDVGEDGTATLWNHCDSSDVWAFKGTPPSVSIAYPIGTAGVDNKIPYEFEQAGWAVLNPSKTIKTYHVHRVPWRSYLIDPEKPSRSRAVFERVPPPYKLIWPSEL